MKPVGPVIEIYASARPQTRRRVEKTNMSSRLEDDRRRAGAPAMLNAPGKPAPGASRFDTNSSAGLLADGIPAGFIAQILGQILSTNKADAARRAHDAYAQTERDPAQVRLIRWA